MPNFSRKSINGDLSPIASFIAGKFNTSHNSKELVDKALNIIKEIDYEYKWLYETLHYDGKTKGIINFVVWSEVFLCHNCSKETVYWDNILTDDKKLKEMT